MGLSSILKISKKIPHLFSGRPDVLPEHGDGTVHGNIIKSSGGILPGNLGVVLVRRRKLICVELSISTQILGYEHILP
jgi:hypothetical protein